MHAKHSALIAALSIVALSGCATNKMALSDDAETVDKVGKPIYLMTVRLSNNVKPGYQPQLDRVWLRKIGPNIPRDGTDDMSFSIDDKAKKEPDADDAPRSYLLRMALEKGNYSIRNLGCLGTGFMVRGMCFAPIFQDLSVENAGVYYLGHVEATIRPRVGEEFRAGPVIPLIDQSVTGFADGTFDVAITDRFEQDVPEFVSRFPALKGVNIQKATLRQWDRATAQKWWNGDLP